METSPTTQGWINDVQVASLVGQPVEWIWAFAMSGTMPRPDIMLFRKGHVALLWKAGKIDRWMLCGTPSA